MPKFSHGPLAAGVIRADETSFDASVQAQIEAAGGMWRAGDYYADPETIVATARANGVRALRLDARDLGFLADLPQLEFRELRSDGRANLDPVASLPNLRALLINHSALTGTISLDSHPRLEWLAIKLSGRGGRENLPRFLAGHPGIRHLRLSEVSFTALADFADAFPSLVTLSIHGGERMRSVGDVSSWAGSLERLWMTWVRLRSFDGVEALRRLRCFGASFSRVKTIAPLAELPSLALLSILDGLPSLAPLSGKRGLRIARLSMPDDGDLAPLRTWPDLVGLVGRKFLGDDVPVPYLEDLPAEHPLRLEWFEATGTRPVLGL